MSFAKPQLTTPPAQIARQTVLNLSSRAVWDWLRAPHRMGPRGCASKFVTESLRGMKGVVASSSTGWGVARFIVLPRVLLSWSWEKTR